MERLKAIVDEAMEKLEGTLAAEQTADVAGVIEAAVIRGVLEGQNRAVDACRECAEADQDMAHKIASAIRRKNDTLIANLSSLR